MKTAHRIVAPLLAATTLAGVALLGWAPASLAAKGTGITISSESKLWIEGDSTLHKYQSTAKTFEVKAGAAAAKGDAALTQLEVSVPVKSLKSGEGGLDDNLYKALKADQNPTIRFTLTKGSWTVSPNGTVEADATGKLSIAGAEKTTTLRATGKLTGNTLRLTGSKDLLMSDYGVTPPVLMMGAIKCSDRIQVKFDLVGQIND